MKVKVITGFLIVLSFVGLCYYVHVSTVETGYIDTLRVYNEFAYKQELQAKYDLLEKRLVAPIDSIKLEAEYALKDSLNPNLEELINKFRKDIYVLESQKQTELGRMDKEYFSTVWTHLDEYIKVYGEESKYKIIFGVKGEGNIVYAKQGMDLTDDVIEFVNRKYEGK